MSKLERATHVCLIAICLVSVGVLVRKSFFSPGHSVSKRATQVGKVISLPGVDWSQAPENVVVGLRSDCHYCKGNLPVYRQITEARRRKEANIRFIATSNQAPDVVRAFLSGAGVDADQISQSVFGDLNMPGTPTAYIVDSHGVVTAEFVGAGREKELLSQLGLSHS